MASRKQTGWMVPGFGLPLRWQQSGSDERPWLQHSRNTFLCSALDGSEEGGSGAEALTVRERAMISLMNRLTDTPMWYRKILEQEFVDGWKTSALSDGKDVTQQMVDWCVEEVKHGVRLFHDSQIIHALDRGVEKSDTLVASAVKEALSAAVTRLEKDSETGMMLSSRSDQTVTSVVDPSLFPLIFGTTRVLRSGCIGLQDCVQKCTKGRTGSIPSDDECSLQGRSCYTNEKAWSNRYQWLPCEVRFDNEGKGRSRVVSYINNIHPIVHRQLYSAIELVLDTLIPILNSSLLDLKFPGLLKPRILTVNHSDPELIKREPGSYCAPEKRAPRTYLDEHSQIRDSVSVDLQKEFWDIGIQVIVKVTTIDLTPERPEYDGEPWHVQGQLNERICATVVYFYDCKNLCDGSISFRQRVAQDEVISMNCFTETADTEAFYAIKDGGPMVQTLGDVMFREDRIISFPNTFQIRVNPLALKDASRPGHCKFLTLHLVDPNRRIMSTAMVPCQRRDWWAREVRQQVSVLRRLPVEVFDRIIEFVEDYPLSLDSAQKIRGDFLEERDIFTRKHTEAMLRSKFKLEAD